MSRAKSILERIKPFRRDSNGSVAIIYAAASLVVIGFIALAVDGARAHILKSQLHYAVDAAAIAIGKQMKQTDDASLLALAEKYIQANVSPSLLGLTGDFGAGDLTVQMLDGPDDNIKEIRATARLQTTMLGMLDGAASVNIERSAMVRREVRGLELALALDTTGSMDWSSGVAGVTRMQALKSSAGDLLDIIFDGEASNPKLWVSIVPFTQQVQAKTDISWVKESTMNPPLPSDYSDRHYEWKNEPDFAGGDPFCYGSRTANGHDDDDMAPSSEGLKFEADFQYVYTYRGYWNYKRQYYVEAAPSYLCPQAKILPLTNIKSEIEAHIETLTPYGGTATDRGAVWGWRAVSENWRGYWNTSDPARPFNTDEPLNSKVVVLMTDGENSNAYTSNAALTQICNNMKNAGITVMSINFATPSNLYPLYESCASSPDLFFPAPTATQLKSAFEAIALQLSVLRLIQ